MSAGVIVSRTKFAILVGSLIKKSFDLKIVIDAFN